MITGKMIEKYKHDPTFVALIDSLMSYIHSGHYTPSELREAVIFACTKYELEYRREICLLPISSEEKEAFEILEKGIEREKH